MDFQQLLLKMRDIDQPTQSAVEGCGMPMGQMPPPPPPVDVKPDVPPPSLSVNLNAHGMDDIESMMKLITKVNPDMAPMSTPMAPPMPTMIAIKPSLPPLKPLPDFDADNDDMPGGEMDSDYDKDGVLDPHEKDHASEKPLLKTLDLDHDGDHDMGDHDLEKKEDGGFQSSTTEPDPEFKNADYMLNKLAGGMNKAKHTFPKVADGDNPMQKVRESGDFKEQIKADLRRRLEESKAVAVSEGPMDMLAKAGGAVKGAFKGAVTGAKKAMATPGGGKGKSKQAKPKQALGKVVRAPAGGAGVSPSQPSQTPGAQSAQTQPPSARKQVADALVDVASTLESGGDLNSVVADLEALAKDMKENPQDYMNKGAK